MRRLAACAAVALAAAGCLGPTDSVFKFTLDFDFNVFGENFFPGGADFPEAQSGAVGVFGSLRALPAPLNTARSALYLSGTNVSGDLFLFTKKYVTGLTATKTYRASMQLEFVTNYHAGCTTGPGPNTVVKLGASTTEPLAVADNQGVFRMNINKGAGTSPGDYLQFGDIRNSETGCPTTGTFGAKGTLLKTQPINVTTDANGAFWLWLGTQSSFVGFHEIYFTGMRLVVE